MGINLNKLVQRIIAFYPHLKKDIRIAHLEETPQEFIYKNLKFSFPFSIGLTIFSFFIADRAGLPVFLLPIAFVIFFILIFNFAFVKLKGKIARRRIEIDREVLFAGQYLLIQLHSGKPLLNALTDTSKSYGIASKYIKEIVDDIDTGSSLEKALLNAIIYSPSEKFKKILFHLNNALRLGIDVTKPLNSILAEIAKEQEIEIKRYGKKLNTLVIFYMLAAIVIPSLGMTIILVASSFINFTISTFQFFIAAFLLIILQLFFISIFKSIRPSVNI